MNLTKLISKGTELLIVKAKLSHLKGNKSPYFSITGDIWKYNQELEMKTGRDCIVGGCIHEEILKAFPNMADLVALHLSDIDGSPMYPVENGWYYLQNPQTYNLSVTAKHLRVSLEEALRIQENINTKGKYASYVESCRERWLEEANRAILKYGLKVVNS